MSSSEEAQGREGRDGSDKDECSKGLNTGDIQLVWKPLEQLTPQVQKVTLLGNGRTKDTKMLRTRKRVGVARKGDRIQSRCDWDAGEGYGGISVVVSVV